MPIAVSISRQIPSSSLIPLTRRSAFGHIFLKANRTPSAGYFDTVHQFVPFFEYSATFSQALKAANKTELTEEYARCVLFDYSYKYFYRDGFGKDYRILNLADDRDNDTRRLYLTACLNSA